MSMIQARKVHYDYIQYEEEGADPKVTHAVNGVDLDIAKGQFIAILGHNGSGKSTLARHFNALLIPTEGTVFVGGMDTREDVHTLDIRQTAGMVFQNPDNQIIASVVEEDVGFGPENMGIPTDEIWQRVDDALNATGMTAYREFSPNNLSGGQKQRVAIAGIMAMRPECIVLDEPTAMLDPTGRKEVLKALYDLNKAHGVTVILITHNMEETIHADRIFVMEKGLITLTGTPEEIFGEVEEITRIGLDVPQVTRLAHELKTAGMDISGTVLTTEELVSQVSRLSRKSSQDNSQNSSQNGSQNSSQNGSQNSSQNSSQNGSQNSSQDSSQDRHASPQSGKESRGASPDSADQPLLRLENISYIYGTGGAQQVTALDDISLEISQGEFIGIIGHTGSGKSTLIQHLNGLIRPSSGHVYFEDKDIWADGYSRRDLRFRVGIVFQYPEHQLFETDVISDVCFGPKNMGLSPEEAKKRASEALSQVGISEDEYEKSPFEISGGQKRRVAIAGVLAMNPDVMILDEPSAGLDPKGRREILSLITGLHRTRGISIILVSHSMEDVAEYADRLIVINKGKKAFDGSPKEVFAHYKELEEMDLSAPQVTYICHELSDMGLDVDVNATTVEEAKQTILHAVSC